MPQRRTAKPIRNWAEARERALKSIEAMTDEEDAELTAAALSDPDNPPLTEEFWANAKPMSDERLAEYRNMRRRQRLPAK